MKHRIEYERCVDQYTSAKAKLEEQKSKGSKRTDEYKDRYLKVDCDFSSCDFSSCDFP